ncbi:hypothetical protein POM88_047965 [Heracleum sosnowskyi]|uniref:Letm1 RBD domain-containing protein n=1 Tax=Heracleum sosnowskyi TaxID=360622 RepID=A0AAD8M023_9APIA|nr:hypothetical protein POM88_047965 [Heracleum sosnowskyi]
MSLMEFMLPKMVPSTIQDKLKEQETMRKNIKAKLEYVRFLQDTTIEMVKQILNQSGDIKQTAEELDVFMDKIKRGATISSEEIMDFTKLFNNEVTLDNISRSRLVNICKYLGITAHGADTYLCFMVQERLKCENIRDLDIRKLYKVRTNYTSSSMLQQDDILIIAFGVESLSEAQIREDCRERGMIESHSVEDMRLQLSDWLNLSVNHSILSAILILSRPFAVTRRLKSEVIVLATLCSLPQEVVNSLGTSLPFKDHVKQRRRELQHLEMQDALIKVNTKIDFFCFFIFLEKNDFYNSKRKNTSQARSSYQVQARLKGQLNHIRTNLTETYNDLYGIRNESMSLFTGQVHNGSGLLRRYLTSIRAGSGRKFVSKSCTTEVDSVFKNNLFRRLFYSEALHKRKDENYYSRNMKDVPKGNNRKLEIRENPTSTIYKVKEEINGGSISNPSMSSMSSAKKGMQVETQDKDELTDIKEGDVINLRDLLFTENRDYLIKYNDQKVRAEQLEGKAMLIYFVPVYLDLSYPFTDERLRYLDSEDDEAAKQLSLETLLGSPLRDYVISNKGDRVPIHTLKDKVVALYFYEDGLTDDKLTIKLKMAYMGCAKTKENFEMTWLGRKDLLHLLFLGPMIRSKLEMLRDPITVARVKHRLEFLPNFHPLLELMIPNRKIPFSQLLTSNRVGG